MPVSTPNNIMPPKSSHENKAMNPPKLKMEMSDLDYNELCQALDNKTLKEFIKNYKIEHSLTTNNEVITLGLLKVLNTIETDTLTDLTKLARLFNDSDYNIYPLITLDIYGNNAISYALKNLKGIYNISNYIDILKDTGKITNKFILDNKLIKEIATAIKDCSASMLPKSLIEDMIEPLYTNESVQELRECIGVDWLETYYI